MGTRYEEMLDQARNFHRENPKIWHLFCEFTFELIKRGFKHYGAKSIMERIRWHTDTPDKDGKSTFKINNNYTAFYARGFMIKYPNHDGFFRTREQISKSEEATGKPELTPEYYECTNKD